MLTKSRERNAANNITGVLLYYEGSFIQLLEGEELAVDETFRRISEDRSHRQIMVVNEGELEERNFAAWSMGFQKATAESVADMEAYIDPRKLTELAASDSHPALIMLNTFVRANLDRII